MPSASSDRDQVEILAEEFVERHRRGERPALSEYTDRLPDRADEIRELFPALLVMERLKPEVEAATSTTRLQPEKPNQVPDHLGDYRILREVGRGGMGVVYEAEQVSLGRHVALKVLPAHGLMNRTFLERFRREAKAAAKLHHTNIVPVFGVGDANGTHFYAMQFIRGEGLDRVLNDVKRLREQTNEGTLTQAGASASLSVAQCLVDGSFADGQPVSAGITLPAAVAAPAASSSSRLSSVGRSDAEYHRSVARLGMQAADALAYAHKQGVLHRDIKPSNLLLDVEGTVWITDFGLAKAEGADELTQTGDIVGTIRFMAPERFDGHSLPQGDIYSLGVTLYEMLALRPAFDASHRAKLIEQVLHDSPPPLARLDRRIPRDLDTIVRKCLAKDPAERYASADALAEDLRRYLADRPIKARRASVIEQFWRWRRRNRVVAALLMAVMILLMSVAALQAISNFRVSRALRRAADNLERAKQAERDQQEKLWQSYVDRAKAEVVSRRIGQRFGALAAIREAAKIKVTPEMRDIATAALTLPDFEVADQWDAYRDDTFDLKFDQSQSKYVRIDKAGNIDVCRRQSSGEEVIRHLPAEGSPPTHHCWLGPDGRYLAYGSSPVEVSSNSLLSIRDLETGRFVLRDQPGGVLDFGLAFDSSSGHVAVAQIDGQIAAYRLSDGQRLWTRSLSARTTRLHYHPSGNRIAAVAGNSVKILDAQTGAELRTLNLAGTPYDLAWHPDGRALAVSVFNLVHIYDSETGDEIARPWVSRRKVAGIAPVFNQAGDRVISSDWGGGCQFWDAISGQLLLQAPATPDARFAKDDTMLALTRGGAKVVLWHVANGREFRSLHVPIGSADAYLAESNALSSDGRIAASVVADSGRYSVCFFDLISGKNWMSQPFTGDKPPYWLFANAKRGWLSVYNGAIMAWPVSTPGNKAGQLTIGPPERLTPAGACTGLPAASRDGRFVAIPISDGAYVDDLDRPGHRIRLGPQFDVRIVAVSPNGKFVATCSWWQANDHASGVQIWDASTGKRVAALPMLAAKSAAFSTDDRWLVTENQTWDTTDWHEVRNIPGRCFTADGKMVAAESKLGSIQLVESATGRIVVTLAAPDPIRYIPSAFSADGSRLLAIDENNAAVHVWDLRRIRAQLKEIGLDWDWPEFPPAPPEEHAPIELKLIGVDLLNDPKKMAAHEKESAVLALTANPFNAEAHNRLGESLLGSQNPLALPSAYAEFSLAVTFDQNMTQAHKNRARAAVQLGLWKQVIEDSAIVLKKWPDDPVVLVVRGQAYQRLGRHAEAIADFSNVIRRFPAHAASYRFRADSFEATGKLNEAKADRARASELTAAKK